MAISDFKIEIQQNEVVVTHVVQGHTYRFPVVAGTAVSFRAVIEPNLRAKRHPKGYLLQAYNVARATLE